ncbi:aromatic acid exporter family protein [Lacticigenium naphthae]|uniref:aromatic acid exporter family protein n=1 Tax=Lacticigenium naphthae TaxID=515351 RepID=UPI0003FD6BAE|nr:aromatic acid exporter family protein [Lacticigenium naphthae]
MSNTQKTIKIVLATLLSIWLAEILHLESSLAAGIIAILSILDTKKASIIIAVERILSTIIALTIATLVFNLFGYSVIVFGLYLLLYVPLAYRLRLQAGLAPCSVLVTHLILAESTSLNLLMNEFLLMLIGVSVALIFNLYMPSQSGKLDQYKTQIEMDMQKSLFSIDRVLRKEDKQENLLPIIKMVNQKISEAQSAAIVEQDNQLFNQENEYLLYFIMRKEQMERLEEISENLDLIQLSTEQNKLLGGLFYLTASQLHEKNTAADLLRNVDELHQSYKKMKLPQTRAEFESRAVLYLILHDLKRFLELKNEYIKRKK